MGKTKRSNRVKGGKTRKYKGGAETLKGKSITFSLYVTENGVLLGDPKVSTIRTGINPVPKNSTPLTRVDMKEIIQTYIIGKMGGYNLDSVNTALDTTAPVSGPTPASTPGTGTSTGTSASSKTSTLSNMKSAISGLTKSKIVSDEDLFNNAKQSLIKKITELTPLGFGVANALSALDAVFTSHNIKLEIDSTVIADLTTDATMKLTNFNKNINSISKTSYGNGIKIGQSKIQRELSTIANDRTNAFLQALFNDPKIFTTTTIGVDLP